MKKLETFHENLLQIYYTFLVSWRSWKHISLTKVWCRYTTKSIYKAITQIHYINYTHTHQHSVSKENRAKENKIQKQSHAFYYIFKKNNYWTCSRFRQLRFHDMDSFSRNLNWLWLLSIFRFTLIRVDSLQYILYQFASFYSIRFISTIFDNLW